MSEIARWDGAELPELRIPDYGVKDYPARKYVAGPVRIETPQTPAPSMGPLHADAHPSWRLWAGNVALGIRLLVLVAVCLPVIAGGIGAFLLIAGWVW